MSKYTYAHEQGQSCDTDGCNARLHLLCVAKIARGRESLKCPKCHREWPHEIPEIDWMEEEQQSDDHSMLPISSQLNEGRPSSSITKKRKASGGHSKH